MKHLDKPLFIFLLTLAAALCLSAFALAAPAEPLDGAPAEETAAEEAEPASAQFADLSYSENESALSFMIDRGFIAGYTDGTFRPGRGYTRLELAQLVTALCGLDTADGRESGFYDCELAGADAIEAAVSNGLMTGRSAQSFDPYGSVLKAEMLGTLEKAAAYLELDGFYDHAGSYTDWRTDYTICTADEAMQSAYPLAQALELRAEAEAKAAETEAAARAVAALNGEGAASAEPAPSGEMTEPAETAAAPSGEPETAAQTDGEPASETVETEAADGQQASAEPGQSSSDPSEEPDSASSSTSAEPSAKPAADTAPPAGVTAPAPAAQPSASAPAEPVPTAAPEPDDESDALRNEVKDKYSDIRDSIIRFLRGLFGG